MSSSVTYVLTILTEYKYSLGFVLINKHSEAQVVEEVNLLRSCGLLGANLLLAVLVQLRAVVHEADCSVCRHSGLGMLDSYMHM